MQVVARDGQIQDGQVHCKVIQHPIITCWQTSNLRVNQEQRSPQVVTMSAYIRYHLLDLILALI
jgi:hypothetical protein